jgi:hypothetical protein
MRIRRIFTHVAQALAEGILIAVLVVGLIAGTAFAAAHRGPKADPPCSVNPSPAVVGEPYIVSTNGLPTATPVYLIVQPPAAMSTSSPVDVSADGTWVGTEFANEPGTWTYTFSGVLSNHKYGTVSSCSVLVN